MCKDSGTLEWQGHPLAGAPRVRHEGIRIPANAWDFRPPAVHVSMPYQVHEIFNILSDTGHKCWYDPAKKMWVMTGESATDVLKWIVQVVCQRDLSNYKNSAVEIKSQWKFSNQSFVKAAVDACRTGQCVYSLLFQLDNTRHLGSSNS